MKILKAPLKDLLIIEPKVFKDARGYFLESYHKEKLNQFANIEFIQDNESCSQKDVLRGLHFQQPPYTQAKLIRVIKGAILDVVVDLRRSSKNYGQHFNILLNEDNKTQLFVPEGFAHGFLTLADNTIINYKCSKFYNPTSEISILWNDPSLKIDWPIKNPSLSEKDKNGLLLSNFDNPFN